MSDDLRSPSPDAEQPDADYLAEVRRLVAAARRSPEVDDELLADYVGGALAGTGVEEQVAELIATRPEWRSAHAAAVPADAAVRADLAHVGTVPTTMPPELLSRLGEGFREQRPAGHPVVALDRDRRSRRRRAQWLAGAAAGVLVLAFAGIAGASVLTGGQDRDASSSRAGSARQGATPSPTTKGPNHAQIAPKDARPTDGVRLAASGTDYTVDTVPQAADRAGQQALSSSAVAAAVPGELRPLTDPARLDRCLHQLGVPGGYTASLVDFALFRSRPAAVVVASAGSATRISVVGPECGTDGAHLQYQTSTISLHAS
ncbi:hypothetical protein Athai_63950 [Actinocatenispora thailandica]|uniref:Uncharacterized protein n=1 Tax=Actinocatenispora thailandica TaxID=227318 RepID=A0A7R7DVZ4_9ACTN|nr:hypothetical protein [Actinocatenispora thailandica]BCJ38892.1 hypothetical protein Athai_63950 [Actinocatenispora thailandica]